MGMIKGIAVTLIDSVETGKDPFGNPIYEDKEGSGGEEGR